MRGRKGFTLVELLVLIGIIGLLAAVSMPSVIGYVRSNRLATTTERMASDLQMIRSMSIANGRIYRVTATANGYVVTDPVSGDVVRDRGFENGVTLDAAAIINFFPWGMADAAVFNLRNNVGTRSITVLPTGVVEVQ
jgi:prepilin-type N-terminal cleavage/methylation domain-containing protein